MSAGDRHQHVTELMPWYVNGSLSETETVVVEQHVHGCLTCYARLQHERKLRSLVYGAERPRASPEHGFERLMENVEGRRRARQGARVSAGSARGLRMAALGAAAAFIVLIAAGLVLVRGTAPEAGPFRGLTSADVEAGRPRIDVVFAAGVSEGEMRTLLREIDGTIVAGPSRVGRYTIELEAGLEPAELAALLARLERDERLRFAGRSFGAGEE